MSNETVKSSTRLWSSEVAAARASTELDTTKPGGAGIDALTGVQEVAYEFSNGRKFKDRVNPYA